MKKFLSILGASTLVVIVVAAIGLGIFVYKANALDAQGKAFVDRAIPAIAAQWSPQQLFDRAAPELRSAASPDQVDALFQRLSRLGPLVAYEGATGQATMSYFVGSGGTVSAAYVAKAQFENGSATFQIGLVKRDGRWMIRNLHVDTSGTTQAPNSHA